jgi:hypothetical protein
MNVNWKMLEKNYELAYVDRTLKQMYIHEYIYVRCIFVRHDRFRIPVILIKSYVLIKFKSFVIIGQFRRRLVSVFVIPCHSIRDQQTFNVFF